MKILKKLLIVIPVVIGVVIFAVMKINKKPPERIENLERVQTVRVISLEKMSVVPRVISYGYVESDRTWQGISEVSGKVVFVNENLEKGVFIKKDEVLLKIDATNYGLAETSGVADLMNVDARLRELEQSRKNTQRLLDIEKKSLSSAGLELKRKRELFANQYISFSKNAVTASIILKASSDLVLLIWSSPALFPSNRILSSSSMNRSEIFAISPRRISTPV